MNLLFSRQSSDLDYLVNVIRSSGIEKQREKCSNVQIFTGVSLPHADARVHYYIKENTGNDETNTENTNIDCDDEAFEKPYVRTMYSQLWMYPNLQVFVVAPLIPST